MKKFLVVLGVSALATLTTQGAYANDSAKISVVKGFLACNNEPFVCVDDDGTRETKKFLSKSAIATLERERKAGEFGDCESDIPRCYSGLWTEPGNGGFMWHTPKYTVNGNVVSANFGKQDGVAHFKVVQENGQWKIDNSKHDFADYKDTWWR